MRRTSIKRSSKPLKSGPIKSSGIIKKKSKSKKKSERMFSYHSLVKLRRKDNSKCNFDGCEREDTDPHHPLGRTGDNLLVFMFLCREHHNLVHTNKKKYKEFFS